MASPQEGGRALGEILFGGRRTGVESDAYLSRLRDGYAVKQADYNSRRAMDQAAEAQIQRIAREAISAADIQAAREGDPAAQARLGEAALRTADTPNLRNITGGFADFDAAGYRREAVERVALGDLAGAQAQLFGLARGPQRMNDIDNGYRLNPYEVGGTATPTETENARIDELGARAGVSRAKAATGGWNPKTGSSRRTSAESKAIIDTLQKEIGRVLTAEEVAQVYSGGDFNFPATQFGNVQAHTTVDEKGATFINTPTPAAGAPMKVSNPRVTQVGGKPVVRVNSPAEAKAAWAKLKPGSGLMLPNGTIRYKD